MTKSYRIRTSVNSQTQTDSTIRVKIDQDFDFLEILSLKLTQSDVYRRFCADYGVVVGRVVANGGFGIPNARVSVFVPVDSVDLSNPIISTLYPYTSPTDRNEDGYRFNLLPYEPSYEGHVPTGTFPSKEDILTRNEVLEIYEKYYKYTVKTNESGDYMIVGVPLGDQRIVVDVDLSDMGCFSLRPTDLVRMNRANKQQFDGNNFRSSNELSSLPQIVNVVREVNVAAFWGDNEECNIGITRVDFDLRDQNINIEPTALFMGSIFSSSDEDYLKRNCKPKAEQGDLCGLVTGPGTILAIRQTVNLDQFGRPILEQFPLPAGGKVIDDNGAFVVDVPMNLDYLITDEYGNLVVSQDPKVGIPSKGKYRFKIKYNSTEKDISTFRNPTQIISQDFLNLDVFAPKGTVLRANYLLPNVKEYGWYNDSDPVTKEKETKTLNLNFQSGAIEESKTITVPAGKSLRFEKVSELNSLQVQINGVVDNSKWIDNPGASAPVKITVVKKTETTNLNGVDIEVAKPVQITYKEFDYRYSQFQRSYSFSLDWDDYPNFEDAVECRDTFYEMNYNKVYTVSQLVDEYRKGSSRARFLTIKEILQRSCQSEVNKFPVNDGVRNFDLLYFIISILMTIISIIALVLIPVFSLVKFLWNKFAVFIAAFFIAYSIYRVATTIIAVIGYVNAGGPVLGGIYREGAEFLVWLAVGILTTVFFKQITAINIGPMRLPMITYPDCSSCDCGEFGVGDAPPIGELNTSVLADVNIPTTYQPFNPNSRNDDALVNQGYGQVAAGRDDRDDDQEISEARTPRFTFRVNEYWTSNYDDRNRNRPGRDKNSDCNDNLIRNFSLPIPERINLYNTKGHYFDNMAAGGSNRIKVWPNYLKNGSTATSLSTTSFYEDQPLVVLCDPSFLDTYSAGTMISFVSVENSKDVNLSASTITENSFGLQNVTGTTLEYGSRPITIKYANPQNPNSQISKQFTVEQTIYQNNATPYAFPSDIEYYQIITGYTLNNLNKIMSTKTLSNSGALINNSFYRRVIKGEMLIGWGIRDDDDNEIIDYSTCQKNPDTNNFIYIPIDQIPSDARENLVVAIIMKGVDPYSQRQQTKIDVSKIFGLADEQLVCESQYKLNIPIQTGLTLDNYSTYTNNNNTQLFHSSYFFTASTQTTDKKWKYSAYTTNNQNLYNSITYSPTGGVGKANPGNQIITNQPDGYYNYEYIEGAGFMYRKEQKQDVAKKVSGGGGSRRDVGVTNYYRNVYNPTATTMNMVSNTKLVMRSDRLPRSDSYDNNFSLAQNKAFGLYPVSDIGYAGSLFEGVSTTSDFSTNDAADFEESYGTGTTTALSTFTCEKMVPLSAYTQGDYNTLKVIPENDPYLNQDDNWKIYWLDPDRDHKRVINGCYQIGASDLKIAGDLRNFMEWKARFMVGLAICRNVFGMTFTNQWINGSLYMPGFQNDKIYLGNLNVSSPTYTYCKDKIVFRIENNSFFYRSSPYDQNRGFVGMLNTGTTGNDYFLGNPTTIMDLGPKDNIIKNICPQPQFQGYVMNRVSPTSYNSVADLLQLFTVSRLSNASWGAKILSSGNASVGQFFSRESDRIDGDFAQLSSINSEFGVVPFTPEGYQNDSLFYNKSKEPIIGVFFTGETTDRDYLSPGRESFIDTAKKYGYETFGKKSQIVPMYKWELKKSTEKDSRPVLFGSENNDWYTKRTNNIMFSIEYQNIDRRKKNTYFPSPITLPTTEQPGYIYASKIAYDSNNNPTGFTYDGFYQIPNAAPFIVGAPYHFYFGLKVGKTAMDKFITDYALEV